ncbi:hypothetical protein LIA77_04507 [Sarocladium implicatum]|nr:hypothetical protein LIA77_04507 [Sarocladium implicatum]
MGSPKRRRLGHANSPRREADDIDLLGLAFNVPTRDELRRRLNRNEAVLTTQYDLSDESEDSASDYASSTDAFTDDDKESTHILLLPARRSCTKRHQSKRHKSSDRSSSVSTGREDIAHASIACKKKRLQKPAMSADQAGKKDTKQRETRVKMNKRKISQRSGTPSVRDYASSGSSSSTSTGPHQAIPPPTQMALLPQERHPGIPETIAMQRPPAPPVPFLFRPPLIQNPPTNCTPLAYSTLPADHIAATQPPPPTTMYLPSSGSFAPIPPIYSPPHHPVGSVGSNLDSISRLQTRINSLENDQLRSNKEAHAVELKKLHRELNTTLDAATIHQRKAAATAPNTEKGQDVHAMFCEPPNFGESQGHPESTHYARDHGSGTSVEKVAPDDDHSAQPLKHHHCSGCGNIRSLRFHEKHPFRPGQKAVLNYCESCRSKRVARDTHEQYHFCFGCGRVRSKIYQEAHPVTIGGPMPINYCAKCAKESDDESSRTDQLVPGTKSHQADRAQNSRPVIPSEGESAMLSGLDTDREARDASFRSRRTRTPGHYEEMTTRPPETSTPKGKIRSSHKYRRPYVEDSSTVATGHTYDEHLGAVTDLSETLDHFSSSQRPRSSTRSHLSSGQPYQTKLSSGSSVVEGLHEPLDGSVDPMSQPGRVCADARQSPWKAHHQAAYTRETRAEPKSPARNYEKVTRPADPEMPSEHKREAVPRYESTNRHRSAFAGMPFQRRNHFGPPSFRGEYSGGNATPSSSEDNENLNELRRDHSPPKFSASLGAFSRRAQQNISSGRAYRRESLSPGKEFNTRHRQIDPDQLYTEDAVRSSTARRDHDSSQSPPMSTYTTFVPASPNPYYTPQTSPSLFEEGFLQRMGFREARSRKKKGRMLYNPEPITEEALSAMNEAVSPVFLIDCTPYSDEANTPLSSPEYAISMSDSTAGSGAVESRASSRNLAYIST